MSGTNGTNILLLVNTGTVAVPSYEAVGSQRDANITENTATIDMSSKDAREAANDPGRYSCEITLDALYVPSDTAYQAIRDAMRNGEKILVAKEEDDVTQQTANAVITSMSERYPDQADATISISLTLDGAWTEVGT